MKVLIADDSVLILNRLQSILGKIGQVEIVACLNNGVDTLNALRTFTPDVAIIDIRMPGLTGLEVLNTYRKENQAMIFILMTFHSQGYFQHLALKSGSNYFFNKVDEFQHITDVVAELSELEINNYNK